MSGVHETLSDQHQATSPEKNVPDRALIGHVLLLITAAKSGLIAQKCHGIYNLRKNNQASMVHNPGKK